VTLTERDQLALAFTGFRSMRAMASHLGVTHQKLGRWLRGESSVPRDEFTQRGIAAMFSEHVRRAKRAAHVQGLPWIGPVYLDRRPLKDGKPGDRVVINHTQYLSTEIRQLLIAGAQGTQEFFAVSIRSLVDLATYFNRAESEFRQSRKLRNESQQYARDQLRNQIRYGVTLQPIYTKIVNIGKFTSAGEAVRQIQQRLREKHEPATSLPGTVLADEMLFQLYPLNYAARPEAKRSKSLSRRIRRTGGK
jgi:hypothetical protein